MESPRWFLFLGWFLVWGQFLFLGGGLLHCVCTAQCRTLRCSQQTKRRPGLPCGSAGVSFTAFLVLFSFAVPIARLCMSACVCLVFLSVFFLFEGRPASRQWHCFEWPGEVVLETSAMPLPVLVPSAQHIFVVVLVSLTKCVRSECASGGGIAAKRVKGEGHGL